MQGYIDESGTPGRAINGNDYLTVCLVLFDNLEVANRCSVAIDRLRQKHKLSETYEFHFAHNNPKNRAIFIRHLANLDFQFYAISIHKDSTYKHASYLRVAELLIPKLPHQTKINLLMDRNPGLYDKLKEAARKHPHLDFSIKQSGAHTNNLLQLTDYVTAICARSSKKLRHGTEDFLAIKRKCLDFIQIDN